MISISPPIGYNQLYLHQGSNALIALQKMGPRTLVHALGINPASHKLVLNVSYYIHTPRDPTIIGECHDKLIFASKNDFYLIDLKRGTSIGRIKFPREIICVNATRRHLVFYKNSDKASLRCYMSEPFIGDTLSEHVHRYGLRRSFTQGTLDLIMGETGSSLDGTGLGCKCDYNPKTYRDDCIFEMGVSWNTKYLFFYGGRKGGCVHADYNRSEHRRFLKTLEGNCFEEPFKFTMIGKRIIIYPPVLANYMTMVYPAGGAEDMSTEQTTFSLPANINYSVHDLLFSPKEQRLIFVFDGNVMLNFHWLKKRSKIQVHERSQFYVEAEVLLQFSGSSDYFFLNNGDLLQYETDTNGDLMMLKIYRGRRCGQ